MNANVMQIQTMTQIQTKNPAAYFELGEGNWQLLKWKTEIEWVVCPFLNQGYKFLTTCYFLISKSHHGKYIRPGSTWKLKIKRAYCVLSSDQTSLKIQWNLSYYSHDS